MSECSDATGEAMRRLVRYAVGDDESRSKDVNEWSDVVVDGEVCSVGVSVVGLLYPRFLSPRLLSPGGRTSDSTRGSEGTSASGGS